MILATVALLGAIACRGQNSTPASPANSTGMPLTTELVKTGLYLISGAGGNSLLRLSADGLILVDGERTVNHEALLGQVKRISDQPIRVLLNTGCRADKNDSTLRIGGIEVRSMHFGSAPSCVDSAVYFPNLRVVAVGDLYTSAPAAEFAAGLSPIDWELALTQILTLDFDVAVPGKGPPVCKPASKHSKLKSIPWPNYPERSNRLPTPL